MTFDTGSLKDEEKTRGGAGGRILVEVTKCVQVRRDKSEAGTKKWSAKTTYYPLRAKKKLKLCLQRNKDNGIFPTELL